MRISNEIEQNLQFKDARCCEGNNKKCSDDISNIEQLLNMANCNTTSIKLKINKISVEGLDTNFNKINYYIQKERKSKETASLQNQFDTGCKIINDNSINTFENKKTVNDIY